VLQDLEQKASEQNGVLLLEELRHVLLGLGIPPVLLVLGEGLDATILEARDAF
jgi:hypothetical protein